MQGRLAIWRHLAISALREACLDSAREILSGTRCPISFVPQSLSLQNGSNNSFPAKQRFNETEVMLSADRGTMKAL